MLKGNERFLGPQMELTNSCFSQKWEIVRPGAVSPLRHLPDSIPRPPYVPNKKGNLFARNGDGRPSQPEVILFLEATCSVKSVTILFVCFFCVGRGGGLQRTSLRKMFLVTDIMQ